ncbi:MAG: response regulator [Anaerolineae bacterium]|nr:response regulator [Anaerolineae bacterium]
MAGEKIRVMIVDDVAETREQLRKLLTFDPDIQVVSMVGSGEEAVKTVASVQPDVVLMDINLPGIDGITATSKLLEVSPTAQVVMLSVQGESDYMRRAMMAGARDYLTKPPSADELIDAIHRMAKLKPIRGAEVLTPATGMGSGGASLGSAARRGKIITLFSPKGGTGCTTTAVNLAIALQSTVGPEIKVALVDLSLQFGDVAVFMKLQPPRTIADLASRASEMDAELLATVMMPHPSGVKVLAAPPTPEDAESLLTADVVDEAGGNRLIKSILKFTRQEFDYLIVDTTHAVDEVMLALLDLSDMILVLLRPVIPEIRGARNFLTLLQKMNYPMEKAGLVINSVDNKRMGIQPEAIERNMMPALVHVPLDERIALTAANYGVPFVVKEPRAPISQAIIKLAQVIHKNFSDETEESSQPAETQRRSGLGRLL